MRTLAQLPLSEQPRERCLRSGPSALSLRECLALIMGSGPPQIGCLGLASQILEKPGAGLDPREEERAFFVAMESSGMAHLSEILGIGPATQTKILAAFEVGRRYAIYRTEKVEFRKIRSATTLATNALSKLPSQNRTEPKEWLGFIPIYRNGELGEFCKVENGVRTHVNTEPAELFARVLALRPRGLCLFHNHPSGVVIPSEQDRILTRKIAEISQQLDLFLLGHWIVSPQDEFWLSSKS